MILAAVDDLMFASKIRAAAGPAGARVVFARSPDDLIAHARAERPSLVIFDLNSTRLQPLATLAALRADPSLADVRTIGFVSHVQTDAIKAAREAGIGEVLARSAFSKNVGEILAGGEKA
jgi:PleD family two-component response regulator